MAEMPIFNSDPATSLVAIMRFPKDIKKAHAFASQILSSGPLTTYCDQGMSLSPEAWLDITSSMAVVDICEEADHKKFVGLVVGKLVQVLCGLIDRDPRAASWATAFRIVDNLALEKHGRKLGHATFHRYLNEMRTCLHLWGAVAIRNEVFGNMWAAAPSIGYDEYTDLQFLLAESEILLRELLNWNERYKVNSCHLCADHFRVPTGWQPPLREPHWPIAGVVPVPILSLDVIPARGRPGRPSNKMPIPGH